MDVILILAYVSLFTLLTAYIRLTSLAFFFRFKDVFNGHIEQPGHFEGQRQTGIVLPIFNRVDRLPGNVQFTGQLPLCPTALSSQYAQPVLQRYLQLPQNLLINRRKHMMAAIIMGPGLCPLFLDGVTPRFTFSEPRGNEYADCPKQQDLRDCKKLRNNLR